MLIVFLEFTCLSFAFIKSSVLWLFLCWLIFRERRRKKKTLKLIVTWVRLAFWEMDYSKKNFSGNMAKWEAWEVSSGTQPFPWFESLSKSRRKASASRPCTFLFPARFHLRNFRAVLLEGSLSGVYESMGWRVSDSGYLLCSPAQPACRLVSYVIPCFHFYKAS